MVTPDVGGILTEGVRVVVTDGVGRVLEGVADTDTEDDEFCASASKMIELTRNKIVNPPDTHLINISAFITI